MDEITAAKAILWTFASVAYAVAVVVPSCRIVRRLGFPPIYGALAAVPFVNLAALWILAWLRWPRQHSISNYPSYSTKRRADAYAPQV